MKLLLIAEPAARDLEGIVAYIALECPYVPPRRYSRDHRKHWLRAEFFQKYWLFYRFNSDAKVIVLAWVSDEETLRAYGSKTDAYAIFKGILEGGNPPDNSDALMKEAVGAVERFEKGSKLHLAAKEGIRKASDPDI